jgi:hypothetical protein
VFERYAELEITVEPRRGTTYPLSIHGPGGDARGSLRLPIADPAYQPLATRLAALDTDEDSLAQIGQILFSALFRSNPEIRAVYARTQGTLKPDEGLRITFYIGENEVEVAALPWEFLYDPDQIGPMATLDAPIVRYLPQSAVLPHMEAELPLKLLLTGAETIPKPDVARALADVQAALAELGDSVSMTVEPHLTRQKFQRLLRGNYHIWHFIGHGTPAAEGKSGTLLFEDEQGEAERVSARDLGILLNRNSIRLIVLNACDSAKLAIDPFRSVAPALLKAQIPGVIAMQLRVAQDAARAFSSEFYRALAEAYPLDACVTEGRKAIIGASGLRNPDWGIPVVYTRAEGGGRLFERPAAPAATSAPQSSGANVIIGSGNTLQPGSSITIESVGNTNVTGSTIVSDKQREEEERAEQIESLRELIRTTRRRLNQRQLQAAKYGIGADPSITLEIEDLTKEIAKLERELKALGD